MATIDLKSPELYINRELSWLDFNDRVMQEGLSGDVPLLERLKFLAIVSSNLDEFFMIRVAGLIQQQSAGVTRPDPSGLAPLDQLAAISQRTHRIVAEQTAGIRKALAQLAEHGIRVLDLEKLSPPQERFARTHFSRAVLPVLTPLAVEDLNPCPLLPGLRLQFLGDDRSLAHEQRVVHYHIGFGIHAMADPACADVLNSTDAGDVFTGMPQ